MFRCTAKWFSYTHTHTHTYSTPRVQDKDGIRLNGVWCHCWGRWSDVIELIHNQAQWCRWGASQLTYSERLITFNKTERKGWGSSVSDMCSRMRAWWRQRRRRGSVPPQLRSSWLCFIVALEQPMACGVSSEDDTGQELSQTHVFVLTVAERLPPGDLFVLGNSQRGD